MIGMHYRNNRGPARSVHQGQDSSHPWRAFWRGGELWLFAASNVDPCGREHEPSVGGTHGLDQDDSNADRSAQVLEEDAGDA